MVESLIKKNILRGSAKGDMQGHNHKKTKKNIWSHT